MNANEGLAQMMAAAAMERATQLAAARAAAEVSGKEKFDLTQFDALWRDNPDAHHAARGLPVPEEERLRVWAESYYLNYPEVRTIAEWVALLKKAQAYGAYD